MRSYSVGVELCRPLVVPWERRCLVRRMKKVASTAEQMHLRCKARRLKSWRSVLRGEPASVIPENDVWSKHLHWIWWRVNGFACSGLLSPVNSACHARTTKVQFWLNKHQQLLAFSSTKYHTLPIVFKRLQAKNLKLLCLLLPCTHVLDWPHHEQRRMFACIWHVSRFSSPKVLYTIAV